jgi:hypothetical protein
MLTLTLVAWMALWQTAAPTLDLPSAIDRLGSFDFDARTNAARAVRRAAPAEAAPALSRAVESHTDEYVRFRAMVLLSAIDQDAAARAARAVIADRNDRLRAVAYQWFEHHPDPEIVPRLVEALSREASEFVRPALIRALAAHGSDSRAREAMIPLVDQGEDFFRGSAIVALGDYEGRYALERVVAVARLEGPLQDDAVGALGRMGDESVRPVLAELQRTGEPGVQPTVSAALCLAGLDCEARLKYLDETLRFAVAQEEHQPLLRGAVHALGLLAIEGRLPALELLADAGLSAPDRARAPIALGLGTVALRSPEAVLEVLTARPDGRRRPLVELLLEGFDMLSEDFEEERFYAAIRRAYWEAPAGSARRSAAEMLIQQLEF